MLVPLGTVTSLMLVLATKHFVADFLLQTTAMAKGKAAGRAWLAPLLLHALAHAILTLLIALVFCPRAWWIAGVEFVLHATLDRLKALAGRQAGLDPTRPLFWWLFGFDQYLHQMTNVIIGVAFLALA